MPQKQYHLGKLGAAPMGQTVRCRLATVSRKKKESHMKKAIQRLRTGISEKGHPAADRPIVRCFPEGYRAMARSSIIRHCFVSEMDIFWQTARQWQMNASEIRKGKYNESYNIRRGNPFVISAMPSAIMTTERKQECPLPFPGKKPLQTISVLMCAGCCGRFLRIPPASRWGEGYIAYKLPKRRWASRRCGPLPAT